MTRNIKVLKSLKKSDSYLFVDQNKNQVLMFSENKLFSSWNLKNKKYSLLNYILPTEDLDDFRLIKQNINILEKLILEHKLKFDLV